MTVHFLAGDGNHVVGPIASEAADWMATARRLCGECGIVPCNFDVIFTDTDGNLRYYQFRPSIGWVEKTKRRNSL